MMDDKKLILLEIRKTWELKNILLERFSSHLVDLELDGDDGWKKDIIKITNLLERISINLDAEIDPSGEIHDSLEADLKGLK